MKKLFLISLLSIIFTSVFSQSNKRAPSDWYDVTKFGVTSDSSNGVGNAKILDSLNSHVPDNSTIYFPTGGAHVNYSIFGTVHFKHPLHWVYAPATHVDSTANGYGKLSATNNIYHNNPTDTLFDITSAGVTFNGFGVIQNSGNSNPTGHGFYFLIGEGCEIQNSIVSQFGYNIEKKSGGGFVLQSDSWWDGHVHPCIIQDTANTDAGDDLIQNCGGLALTTLSVGANELLLYLSGGGLTVKNSKFNCVNGYVPYCIYAAPMTGDLDFQVEGCGFEQYTAAAIYMSISSAGGSGFGHINIIGNYMDGQGEGGHFVFSGINQGIGSLYAGNITGNTFISPNLVDTAIVLYAVAGFYVGANTYWNQKATVILLDNAYSNNNSYNFPERLQILTETGRNIYVDLGKGTTGIMTSGMTGTDTLRFIPGVIGNNGVESNLQGAPGAVFRLRIVQDGTGGRVLYIPFLYVGSGLGLINDINSFSNLPIDTRPGASTYLEGYINENGYPVVTKIQYFGSSGHLLGQTTPAITGNNHGAGTSPTLTIAAWSTDEGGTLTVTTGTTPVASDTVISITYANGGTIGSGMAAIYHSGTAPIIWPANGPAASLGGSVQVFVGGTTTTFYIFSNTTPLAAATTYKWNYLISGK